jgi:hypothetical protein
MAWHIRNMPASSAHKAGTQRSILASLVVIGSNGTNNSIDLSQGISSKLP